MPFCLKCDPDNARDAGDAGDRGEEHLKVFNNRVRDTHRMQAFSRKECLRITTWCVDTPPHPAVGGFLWLLGGQGLRPATPLEPRCPSRAQGWAQVLLGSEFHWWLQVGLRDVLFDVDGKVGDEMIQALDKRPVKA